MERTFRELALGLAVFYNTLLEAKLEPTFAEELTRAFLQEIADLFKDVVIRAYEDRKG